MKYEPTPTGPHLKHIMIDIETLGTKPGAVITQIAAKRFDPYSRLIADEGMKVSIDIKYPKHFESHIDADTLKWWLEQDPEVFREAMTGTTPIATALVMLDSFCANAEFFWAKSPDFDMTLLEYFFTKEGRSTPWTYRNKRDVRTVLDITRAIQPDADRPHDPMSDCDAQIAGVLTGLENYSIK